jgi:hypothetical protein
MYTLTVAFSFGGMSALYADLMKAVGASEHVFQLIDRVPQVRFAGGVKVGSVVGRIEFQDVHFNYPSRPDVPVLQGKLCRTTRCASSVCITDQPSLHRVEFDFVTRQGGGTGGSFGRWKNHGRQPDRVVLLSTTRLDSVGWCQYPTARCQGVPRAYWNCIARSMLVCSVDS